MNNINELLGGEPQTPVLKPVVEGDHFTGETLTTELKQSTGKMCIKDKNYEY